MADSKLGRWPVAVEVPVAWGEMDAYGHVNNAVYARWCETARIAYLAKVGVLDRLAQGQGPILARLVIDFRAPVVFPDTVRVEATVTRIGNSSVTMLYRLARASDGASVAAAESVVVLVDQRSGKPVPLDDALRRRIAEVEAAGPGA